MITKVLSIIAITLCVGGVFFAVYDMITGKITDDPTARKKVLRILYIILILMAVNLIVENIEKLLR